MNDDKEKHGLYYLGNNFSGLFMDGNIVALYYGKTKVPDEVTLEDRCNPTDADAFTCQMILGV